jgi:hypothetical protein
MVTLRRVAVHRVMVARKRMRRPILTMNFEIVDERILYYEGSQGPTGHGSSHSYTILYLLPVVP